MRRGPDGDMSIFDLDRIRRETFIRQLDFHDEIDSTNTRALTIAAEAQGFPTLVLAERQTAGRGRGDHSWWAGPGSLTLSLLLRTGDYAIQPGHSPLMSLTAGLAVAQAASDFVPTGDVRLKWPNDVFINGRKACGILLETASNHSGRMVVGIGLNVNNSARHAPPELQSTATSLCDVTGKELDRTTVLIALLHRLEKCLKLLQHDIAELADLWRSRCYLQGRTVQIQPSLAGTSSDRVTGVCQSIDDDGALLLQTETTLVRCISGVVAKIL